ncbi:MAG: pitrilysin family protein [Planctomycetota bacterium]|nr:pitrilysin family protein [Planctomycetota bacterium]
MMSEIITARLECGAPLVVEPMPNVASVALDFRLPVGSAGDPPDRDGLAALLAELVFRGAGGLSSRDYSDALDRLGVQRSSRAGTHHLALHFTQLGDRFEEALPLLAMLVREPALPGEALDAVRSLCLQALDGLVDDPQELAMIRVRERHRSSPFNRHGYGERSVLETATADELRRAWDGRCAADGSIIAAAGAVDPNRLTDQLNERLAAFPQGHREPRELAPAERGYLHVEQETAQVHIALAYDAPREADENSMLERLAVNVLGGSTSGRLFTEARQKRSLCYSVGASYRGGRDDGLVTLYAGTTRQRAQETIDVCLAEIRRLREGIEPEEFQRAVRGLKSRLIMQGESTPARAAALAADQHRLGRARTLEELAASIDAIELEALNAYLADRAFGALTAVSIGPAPLEFENGLLEAGVAGASAPPSP